jgi:ubiquinone biosynthesis protein
MKRLNQLTRLFYIAYVLAKNGLDQMVFSLQIFAPFRFVMFLNPWNWFRKTKKPPGVALRESLETLGPIFIKFGQALSTRPDIFPEEMITELAKLQDNVPPFKTEQALSMLEKAFGQSAFEVFAEFDSTVLASASISQVHAATLKSGETVVVKILRPNIKKLIQRDISLLKSIASLIHTYWPESRRLRPKDVVREFEQSLLDELDLQREAANASQLKRNFTRSPLLYVPQIHWEYTHENILVMERIYGIPVTDIKALRAQGICLKALAERGVEIFFTQVFRDCFFHADMHPGNIFVSPKHLENPQYICVDFGIMGALSESDKRYLAENLLAFFNRDYRRVAQLHIESGWVQRDTRIDAFESAIRTVCEPIFEKPLKDISFAFLMLRLFQVARRFHMQVQPELILLQKTLLAVEGLGRQLYPDLDLWCTAKPFLEKWVREQMGPRALFKHLRDNLPFLIEELPHMPKLINDLLVLNKAHSIHQHDAKKALASTTPSAKHRQIRGAIMGSLITLFALAGLQYMHLI